MTLPTRSKTGKEAKKRHQAKRNARRYQQKKDKMDKGKLSPSIFYSESLTLLNVVTESLTLNPESTPVGSSSLSNTKTAQPPKPQLSPKPATMTNTRAITCGIQEMPSVIDSDQIEIGLAKQCDEVFDGRTRLSLDHFAFSPVVLVVLVIQLIRHHIEG